MNLWAIFRLDASMHVWISAHLVAGARVLKDDLGSNAASEGDWLKAFLLCRTQTPE